MTKSPLERAARALCELAGNPPGATMDGKPLWMDYLPEVSAVLTAIREPNNAVREAMRANVPVDGHEWDYQMPEKLSNGMILDDEADCWRAMIDAMLEEGS